MPESQNTHSVNYGIGWMPLLGWFVGGITNLFAFFALTMIGQWYAWFFFPGIFLCQFACATAGRLWR